MKHCRQLIARKYTLRSLSKGIATLWVVLTTLLSPSFAQRLNTQTSWTSNSFGTSSKWVQNAVTDIDVSPDGAIFTADTWDEGGRCTGKYKNGDVVGDPYKSQDQCWCWGTAGTAVAVDATNVYISACGGSIRKFDQQGTHLGTVFEPGSKATSMTIRNGKLFVLLDNTNLKIYNLSNNTETRNFNIAGASGKIAVDTNENIWIVVGSDVKKYSSTGNDLNVKISSVEKPVDVSIDNIGRLMVSDGGYKRQIFFFDVSGTPTLVKTFGDLGGISSGVPGEIKPLKFFGIVGAGTDSDGNIYVVMSESSTVLRKFSPDGQLIWDLQGLYFTDNSDFEAASDGKFAYGKNEIISLDYTKTTPGTEWKYVAHTMDVVKYPNDPRNDRGTSVTNGFVRNVNGHKLLFTTGMYASQLQLYYFNYATDGYIAIPSSQLDVGWAFSIDTNGNVWVGKSEGIFKYSLTGFNNNGSPNYSALQKMADIPAPLSTIERMVYVPDGDIVYVSGFTPDKAAKDFWGVAGRVLTRIDNISSTKIVHSGFPIEWAYDEANNSWPNGKAVKAFTVAGDRLFALWGVKGPNNVVGELSVYNTQNGQYLGYFSPEDRGQVGWVDIPYAVNAYKRSNGEYDVLVEENLDGKSLLYRYCPTGNCTEPPTCSNAPVAPTNVTASAGNTQISLTWAAAECATSYNVLRSTTSGGPYTTVKTGLSAVSYVDTGLTNGSTYYYVLTAQNDKGTSANSLQVASTVGANPLRDPENPANATNGVNYSYYQGTYNALPDFNTLTALKSGVSTTGFDLSPRTQDDFFAFKYTGYISVPTDGNYTFYTSSDDGSKLYIGSTLVVDNDGLHGVIEKNGTIGLKAGKHSITVTFFEKDGGQSLTVSYSSAAITKTAIAPSVLYIQGAEPVDPPGTITAKATNGITLDGNLSETSWKIEKSVNKATTGTTTNTVTYGAAWNDSYLYIGVKVLDPNLFNDSANDWDDDAVEIYIDGDHSKSSTYDSFDRQFIKGYNSTTLFSNGSSTGVLHASATITGGYTVELAIPWTNLGITPSSGLKLGLDVAVDDDNNGGSRDAQVVWFGTIDNYRNTIAFGDLILSSNLATRTTTNLPAIEEPEQDLKIYPNPASNEVTITSQSEIQTIQVIDESGRIDFSREIHQKQTTINIKNLQKGLYLIKAKTLEGVIVKRLVIER